MAFHKVRERIDYFFKHPGFIRYFFNTGWMFTEKILRLISGLFIGAYVARYLGPEHYGLLNYVISLVSLYSFLSSLGLDQVVIRELVKSENNRDLLLGSAAVLKFVGACLVFIMLTITIQVGLSEESSSTLIYIVALGTIFETAGVIDFFFQAKVQAKFVVISQIIALTIVSLMRIYFVLSKAPLQWFAWTNTVDLFIVAVGLIYFYQKSNNKLLRLRFNYRVALNLLKDSWPLIFSTLAVTIYMKIDQVMVKWMLGDRANGLYAVAVRLSEMWNFIPMAFCASMFPAILNAKLISNDLYLKRMQWLYDLMVFISIGIAIPMTFLSEWTVTLLFGQDYADAGNILSLYIWSGVFVFMGVANGKWVVSENLLIFRMTSLVGAGLLNIILNLFLIPGIGLYGAAIATIIAYSFAGYFSFLFTKRTRPIFVSLSKSLNPIRLFGVLKMIFHGEKT